jgi:hypothetical protein
MSKKNFLSAVVLTLISLAVWSSNFDHDFGALTNIGPGFIPKILITLLFFSSFVLLLIKDHDNNIISINAISFMIPGIVFIFALLSWISGIYWATVVTTILSGILWKQKSLMKLLILTVSMICLVYAIFEILIKI